MTHEPMNTAPRDGREVWLMLKSGGQLVKCRWTKHEEYPLESWVSVDEQLDGEYEDDQVSGWLDIEALARDSERLNHILRNQGQCEIQPQPWIKDVFDATCETCPLNITEWEQAWLTKARAAIDKEMDNGA